MSGAEVKPPDRITGSATEIASCASPPLLPKSADEVHARDRPQERPDTWSPAFHLPSIDARSPSVTSTSGRGNYARAGAITTVTVTTSEDPAATPAPAATIAGQAATVTGSGTEWTASYEVLAQEAGTVRPQVRLEPARGPGSGERYGRDRRGANAANRNTHATAIVVTDDAVSGAERHRERLRGQIDDVAPERISVIRVALDGGKHPWEGRHSELRDDAVDDRASRVMDALVLWRASI